MKTLRLFIFACSLSVTFHMQAQPHPNDSTGQADSSTTIIRTRTWSREIGLNVYSLSIRGGDFYSGYKAMYDHYAASGISFKLFHNKSAIRTSLDYFQKIISDLPRFRNEKAISFKTLQVAVGYQRHFGHKRIMPYVFTDLFYSAGKELTQPNYTGLIYYLPYYSYNYSPVTIKTRNFGVTPGIGIRLRLRKNIILNLETGAEFFYQKQLASYPADVRTLTGINLKPLKCSFGFTF